MGQGDAGEIPDSARGGQTKTALLLKNSFCDGQLSGNLKTLLLPFLTVFCGGWLIRRAADGSLLFAAAHVDAVVFGPTAP